MSYTVIQASRIVGLSASTVLALARAGVISTASSSSSSSGAEDLAISASAHLTRSRALAESLSLSFGDLRALQSLSDVPEAAVLRLLRRHGPTAVLRPAGGRRLCAIGSHLVVVEPDGRMWDAETGQGMLALAGPGLSTGPGAGIGGSVNAELPAPVVRVSVVVSMQPRARPRSDDQEGEGAGDHAVDPEEIDEAPSDPFERALLLEDTDPEAAAELYRDALYADPEREDAYLNLGVLMQSLGRLPEALTVYKEGMRRLPTSSRIRFNRGVVFQALGSYEQAKACYLEAVGLEPGYRDAHHNLALCCIEVGDAQGAVKHTNEARRLVRRERA